MTLIRGLPGSGKSTLAEQLVTENPKATLHLEADMFFVDDQGEYHFDAHKLSEAHTWCEAQCELALKQKKNVIIANTFVKQWEMKVYRQLAKKYHANLVIKVCSGNFQSIHCVPSSTIKKMKQQWQA